MKIISDRANTFNCFNYCMDDLWSAHLSGVVIDSNTKLPIVGALVIITDSETQYCLPCEPSTILQLRTDKNGRFELPHGERQSYQLNIHIEADNCDFYTNDHLAFELEPPVEDMIGKAFELTCTLPIEQTPEN